MTKHSNAANNLFTEFSPVSRKEWEERIHQDLKGADYKEKLKWRTLEGFEVLPFYRSDNLEKYHRTPLPLPGRWLYCETVTEADPAAANKMIKEAIRGGADAISIRCSATPHAGALGGDMSGVQLQSQKDLAILLEDISLPDTHLFFDSGMISTALAAMLQNRLSEELNAAFLFDPFTYVARHGRMPLPEKKLNHIIQSLSRQPALRTLGADALYYQQAGATIVQEIGIAIAIGSEFLSRCREQDAEKAAKSMFVRLSAGSLYFPEIAKIRALRLLWPQMLKAYGVEDTGDLWIHSETTQVNKTITGPHNNMLRATTEAMSAVIGGSNSLVINPYDTHFRKPDSFSRRIARNVHHILNEEAGFTKVQDAGAGSWYIEILTDTIAEKSWDFFRLIEKQGGFLKALQNRVVQNAVTSSREEKEKAYAEKKKVLIGTSQYPNPEEDLPESSYHSDYVSSLLFSGETYDVDEEDPISMLKEVFLEGASVGDIIGHILSPQEVLYPSLSGYQAGDVFDQIRLKTRELSRKNNHTPLAVLVPVGNPSWRKARASFAQNVLGCAGFRIIQPQGYKTIEEAQQELDGTDADLYVLCSSDKEYPALATEFSHHFSGGNRILILAGNPGKNPDQYLEAGIGYFLYSGINLPELLTELQHQIFETESAL